MLQYVEHLTLTMIHENVGWWSYKQNKFTVTCYWYMLSSSLNLAGFVAFTVKMPNSVVSRARMGSKASCTTVFFVGMLLWGEKKWVNVTWMKYRFFSNVDMKLT